MDKEPRMTGRPEEAGEEYGTARYTPERRGGRGEAGYNTLRYDPGRFNINEPRPEPARQSLTHHSVRPAAHTSKPAAGERFDEEPDDAGYAERSAAKERYDERPKVKERYDERPKTKEHYDERPKTKERYDERPKAKERYDERPKTDERYDERHKTDERYDERPSPSARAPASRRRDEDPRARERYSGAPSRERYEEEPPRERYPERPPQREREAYGSDGKGYPPRKPAGRKKKYKSRVAAFYTAAIF
ncbi:MAG: hypothetical protein FWF44_11425, partial [Defluviitaleaceae bacterium]|nr:hypothetical protein [Defluviitaleaceae bacterium]